MYRNLLPFLRCPTCGYGPLILVVGREDEEEVIEGGARCVRCAHVTPIQDGILDAIDGAPVPVTPAQLTNYLPPAAWGYERLWRWQALSLLSGKRFPLRDELKLVVGLMDPQRGGLLIDVACSNGLYARAFALAAPTAVVAGIDHSRPMLEEARRYARRAGLAISFVRASAQSLPFASGTVAGYGMGGSLNEIGDIDAALVEARRLLADDGRLVTMNLLAAERGWGRLPQRLLATGGITFPEQASLNRQFERAGLCPVAQWRWRVVEISLLLPQPLTPNP